MFPAPSSHCQNSSPEPEGMSELVVVAAATGAAAGHKGRGMGEAGCVVKQEKKSVFSGWHVDNGACLLQNMPSSRGYVAPRSFYVH